ncbi:GFA family protein [Bradyrhizobium sp. MOS002]|uniref:GFA family protein n=1 Tax=Bradyrhizobium sp. MOS002 TaxID=2133947 RepID=UPI0018EDC9F2
MPDVVGLCFSHEYIGRVEQFHRLRGVPKKYIKVADSGAMRIHAFCDHSGAPVYSSGANSPTSYSLRVGALKQRYELGLPAPACRTDTE